MKAPSLPSALALGPSSLPRTAALSAPTNTSRETSGQYLDTQSPKCCRPWGQPGEGAGVTLPVPWVPAPPLWSAVLDTAAAPCVHRARHLQLHHFTAAWLSSAGTGHGLPTPGQATQLCGTVCPCRECSGVNQGGPSGRLVGSGRVCSPGMHQAPGPGSPSIGSDREGGNRGAFLEPLRSLP